MPPYLNDQACRLSLAPVPLMERMKPFFLNPYVRDFPPIWFLLESGDQKGPAWALIQQESYANQHFAPYLLHFSPLDSPKTKVVGETALLVCFGKAMATPESGITQLISDLRVDNGSRSFAGTFHNCSFGTSKEY